MLNFLNGYSNAVCLDDARFCTIFKSGEKKADFLLFNETTVCEYKEIKNFDAPKRVEHLAKKGVTSGSSFERDFYNQIKKVLSVANQQIKKTKEVLDKPGALGLVIIEKSNTNKPVRYCADSCG